VKYYAGDFGGANPQLRRAYEDFDGRNFARAQIAMTSATAAGQKDPLTLTKLAWLLLSRRSRSTQANVERAGKLLKLAQENFDATSGDRETESKLQGTYMIYFQRLKNPSMAAIRGRQAISLAPHLIGNRINYYLMLIEAKQYDDAAMATRQMAVDYPRSVYFQRLKHTANLRVNRIGQVIEACEALIDMTPDDMPTRLQILPYYARLNDTFRMSMQCDTLLRNYETALTDKQKGEVYYYKALVNYTRHMKRKAEPLARQATSLRNSREDYILLGNILYDRRKWKDAILAYHTAQGKPYGSSIRAQTSQQRRNEAREQRKRMDNCIDHLWAWQVKKLPDGVRAYVKKRKEWLKEREVLKHSFVMRNRYGIRNFLIAIGVLMILTGVCLKAFQRSY
jgi:tetratricopeptide (TPR) repeat protein